MKKKTPDEPPRKRHSSEEEDGAADERRQRQRKTGFTAGAAEVANAPGGQQSQTPAEIGEDYCNQHLLPHAYSLRASIGIEKHCRSYRASLNT